MLRKACCFKLIFWGMWGDIDICFIYIVMRIIGYCVVWPCLAYNKNFIMEN